MATDFDASRARLVRVRDEHTRQARQQARSRLPVAGQHDGIAYADLTCPTEPSGNRPRSSPPNTW
jgi:hypothetical protein